MPVTSTRKYPLSLARYPVYMRTKVRTMYQNDKAHRPYRVVFRCIFGRLILPYSLGLLVLRT